MIMKILVDDIGICGKMKVERDHYGIVEYGIRDDNNMLHIQGKAHLVNPCKLWEVDLQDLPLYE